MSPQPGSPFRLHLITAVALMLLAGWIVKLNLSQDLDEGFGWPCGFYGVRNEPTIWGGMCPRYILVDAATAGTLLLVTWGAMEGWLRRAEVRSEFEELCRAAASGRYRWFQLRPSSVVLLLVLLIGIYCANEVGQRHGWPIQFRSPCRWYIPELEAMNIVAHFAIFLPFVIVNERLARARARARRAFSRAAFPAPLIGES
ncbi:MAG: hypothetical protein KIS92_10330 [Planctomycetota bacterium]|nr:hypothetical protein [Planctomycetota bacterium]